MPRLAVGDSLDHHFDDEAARRGGAWRSPGPCGSLGAGAVVRAGADGLYGQVGGLQVAAL
jgi:hypothetical protein